MLRSTGAVALLTALAAPVSAGVPGEEKMTKPAAAHVKACNQDGTVYDCLALANDYRARKDWTYSWAYYSRACKLGSAYACNQERLIGYVLKERDGKLPGESKPAAHVAAPQQVKRWGRNDPIPDASAPYAEHLAAMRAAVATKGLRTDQCYWLDKNKGKMSGDSVVRWTRFREAWKRVASAPVYYCDAVPSDLANYVNEQYARETQAGAANWNSPHTQQSNGGYENSSTLRQKWIDENKELRCYVSNGRRICNK